MLDTQQSREWSKYLGETRRHVQILEAVLARFEIDPEESELQRR